MICEWCNVDGSQAQVLPALMHVRHADVYVHSGFGRDTLRPFEASPLLCVSCSHVLIASAGGRVIEVLELLELRAIRLQIEQLPVLLRSIERRIERLEG